MFRHSLILVALAASVGVPYLSHSSEDLAARASQWWAAQGQATQTLGPGGPPGAPGSNPAAQQIHSPLEGRLPPLEGLPTQDLAEIFRFDVSSSWVISRWPRVSAGLAEIDSQGYRVPLVTGTRQDDLAGSLTYYFDKEQRCARIMFHGTTGDPRRVVALVTRQHGLVHQVCTDPTVQLYQFLWDGKPHSELTIRPARIVRADAPYSRFELNLVLNRGH